MCETRRVCSVCGTMVYEDEQDNGSCPFCGDFMLDGNSPEEDDYDDWPHPTANVRDVSVV